MTGMPEAAIARELALCFTSLAVVTDADVGVDGAQAVSQQAVLAEFARSVARLRTVLTDVVATLDDDENCPCRHALDGQELPFELP
jgi:5'-methylthioadenosine phosphorylase